MGTAIERGNEMWKLESHLMPVTKSKIEWTDSTWSPITGCTKVSPGCKFCYAERIADRLWKGRKFTDVQVHADRLVQPLRWRRPRRIFVNSMSDLFHEAVPFAFIGRIFGIMRAASQHVFQILTKRPERMRRFLPWWYEEGPWFCDEDCRRWPLPNVHLGVSVEDQARADERIPLLLQMPAAIRFLSVEPLLGPVDLTPWLDKCSYYCDHEQPYPVGHHPERPHLDWVIAGGESGGSPERALVQSDGRRGGRVWEPKPETLAWVRSLRDQCMEAGVPFFFKQFGGPTPKAGGRILDGRTWDEYPTAALFTK